MKRHAFTLMEMFIALSLSVIVLEMIFSALYQNSMFDQKFEMGKAEVMNRAYIQERLDQVFANAMDQTFFTDEKGTLRLSFDNGIDEDPQFCGMVMGSLELRNKNLSLILKAEEMERIHTLTSNVDEIKYEFLFHDGKKMKTANEWKKEDHALPFYLKLMIDQEPYIFWINHYGIEVPLE